MFKIFNTKTGLEINHDYAITKRGYLIKAMSQQTVDK